MLTAWVHLLVVVVVVINAATLLLDCILCWSGSREPIVLCLMVVFALRFGLLGH